MLNHHYSYTSYCLVVQPFHFISYLLAGITPSLPLTFSVFLLSVYPVCFLNSVYNASFFPSRQRPTIDSW